MNNIEIVNYIRKTLSEHKLTYGMILFSKVNKEISDYIYENTRFLDSIPNVNKRTRVYCILNDIKELPKCKICGKEILET